VHHHRIEGVDIYLLDALEVFMQAYDNVFVNTAPSVSSPARLYMYVCVYVHT
jgi:hypothetical protein